MIKGSTQSKFRFSTLPHLLLLSLTSCGGYAPVTYPPVGVTNFIAEVKDNPFLSKTDSESFRLAAIKYPTRTGQDYHTIPVGDYLIARVAAAIPNNAIIKRIKLSQFSSYCGADSWLAPHAVCKTDLVVEITDHKDTKVVTSHGEYDIGPKIVVGDISPPFTMGDRFVEYMHEKSRLLIDRAVSDWGMMYAKARE
ncbi:MAG: hypothetical protein ABTQ34_06010 [Bdellovibrionales bacterium]